MQVSAKILHDQKPTYIYKRRLGMTVVETRNSARHLGPSENSMEHCISRRKLFSFLLELITFATGKKETRTVSPPYQPTNSLPSLFLK